MFTSENTLYLDMDGVLADFDETARRMLGMEPKAYEEKFGSDAFWNVLNSDPDFFLNLDPMPDAFDLYNAVKHLEPIILTGIPRGMDPYDNHKYPWIRKWLGLHQKVICCQSSKKSNYIYRNGDILVDDRTRYRKKWEKKGGIFIRHFSAHQSIMKLRDLGVPVK